jgi:hypothetical protein
MPGDETPTDPLSDAPLTIELCPDDGRIVVHRETGLGTYTRTIDR